MLMKAPTSQLNRFVVICTFKSGSRATFDRGLKSAGEALQLGDDLWLLRAVGTAGSVRNHLFQHMGARDPLWVLQLAAVLPATQNFGPEMDARVRAMLYLETPVPQAAVA
jgi:hypothetical protein